MLPPFSYLTEKRLESISFSIEDIKIIQSLNPNKSQGPDNISIRMLQLCGNTIAVPLKIILENILQTGVYPALWKRANVTPIHKKSNKQLLTNYRPISLLSVSSKIVMYSWTYPKLLIKCGMKDWSLNWNKTVSLDLFSPFLSSSEKSEGYNKWSQISLGYY